MVKETGLAVGGMFTFEQIRNGKVIDSWQEKNLVVNEGLNYLLSSSLAAGTVIDTWYIGLFEGNFTPVSSLAAATIAATATECMAYTETDRPEWIVASAEEQQITNTESRASFTVSATKTIYGAFLISDSTKGGTAGVLFAASRFASPRSVIDGDQLLITYTVQATSA